MNVVKTLVFSGFSVLTADLAVIGAAIGACTVPGNLVGRWVVQNTPIRVHIALIEVVVAVGGLYFLWIAAVNFGWITGSVSCCILMRPNDAFGADNAGTSLKRRTFA